MQHLSVSRQRPLALAAATALAAALASPALMAQDPAGTNAQRR